MNLLEKYLKDFEKDSQEINGVVVKIFSEILQDYLLVVYTDEDMHALISQGTSDPIYTEDEIRKLKGTDKETLKEINKVKKTFPSSVIKEHKNRKETNK